MRTAFIDELIVLAEIHDHIALVIGDLGYSVVEPFAERFPDRFINAGVAEQNMSGLAAGMASEGYHVITYSIANYPTFRCAEQVRNDIDYHKLPVTVVAVGGGLAYGSMGYSHHAVQDYALMRSFPNMLIAAPGDPLETRACLRYLVENPQPSYLRLGKAGEPTFHDSIPEVAPGKWVTVEAESTERSKVLLSTGAALGAAIARKREVHPDHLVCSLPLWGMGTKAAQAAQVRGLSQVITFEDHLPDGGFGSWMLESLVAEQGLIGRIQTVSLSPLVCGTVGTQACLNSVGGLC
jgi:transketolase